MRAAAIYPVDPTLLTTAYWKQRLGVGRDFVSDSLGELVRLWGKSQEKRSEAKSSFTVG